MSLPAYLAHYGEIDDGDLLAKALIVACELDTTCPHVLGLLNRAMIGNGSNGVLLRGMIADNP